MTPLNKNYSSILQTLVAIISVSANATTPAGLKCVKIENYDTVSRNANIIADVLQRHRLCECNKNA